MTKSRWVNIYKPRGNMSLTESIKGLNFVEWEIPSVSTVNNDSEIQGRDGVIPGAINFAPFSLVLKFYYSGNDMADLNLFSQTIKSIVHSRELYYVSHSDMPDFKYAVNKAEIEWEIINHGDATFSVTFNCYKGYAESLYSTDDYNLMSNFWQYESGLISDTDIKYIHDKNKFKIYNASSDIINPLLDHNLDIYMTVTAPNGFRMLNKTNKTEFNYLGKQLKKEGTILLNKTYPYMKNKRIGKDTDKGYIVLDKGFNEIELSGDGLIVSEIKYDFNFIYR